MADEPVTTTPEESTLLPIEKTPEVDQRLKEFGLDLDTPEEKKEATPAETPKETPAPVTPQVPAPVETKPEETEEEIEISEEDAQSLIEKQTGEKKGQEEVYPWEKEKREPSQREIIDYVAEKAVAIAERKQAEAAKLVEDQQKAAKQQEEQNISAWKSKWESDVKFLEDKGYITKVVNKNDPNDPGLKDRQALLEQATLNNELDLKVVYAYYIAPNKGKQPAGANAPIAVPRNDTAPAAGEDEEYSYDEIHGKNPAEFDSVELGK